MNFIIKLAIFIFIVFIQYNFIKAQYEENVLKKRSALNTAQEKTNLWINWCLDDKEHNRIDLNNLKQVLDIIQFMSCILFIEFDSCDHPIDNQMLVFKYDKKNYKINLDLDSTQDVKGIYSLNIEKKCSESKGCILRKILLFLGLTLTSRRADRDNFIKVIEKNIDPNYSNYFNINNNSDKSDTSYDFGSVMQVSNKLWGTANAKTFRTVPKNYELMAGQEYGLSFTDIKLLNKRYCENSCIDNDKAKKIECKNGGILSPYTCENCICPNMFANDNFCEKLEPSDPSCPKNLLYAKKKQQKILFKGKQRCNIKIKAIPGKNISVTIQKAQLSAYNPCFVGLGLEVKYLKDKTSTGLLMCDIASKVNLVSEDETVLIQYNGLKNKNMAFITYKSS
uniref:Metalloendopeptidase n=1 Tax=Strongyloides stercoralis TaxID=6248 RepID=A0A0K0EB69_STRER